MAPSNRPHGPDLLSRLPLDGISQQLQDHGITPPDDAIRDAHGALLWLADRNTGLQNLVLTGIKGRMLFKLPKLKLKQELYERVSGTGLPAAENFLIALGVIDDRDALVTMCLILEKRGVTLLPFPSTTKLADPAFMDATLKSQFLLDLTDVALLDWAQPASSTPDPTCPVRTYNTGLVFEKLPKNVRFLVYALIFAEARVVKVHLYKNLVKTTCPPPKVLHFTQESRKFFMNRYVKLNDVMYFNINLDTLAIGCRYAVFNYASETSSENNGLIGNLLKLLPDEVKDGVKKVALGRSVFGPVDQQPRNFGAILAFPALESLHWIHDEVVRHLPHRVEFKAPSSVEEGLVDFTRYELAHAHEKMYNSTALDPAFIVGEVDEVLYRA